MEYLVVLSTMINHSLALAIMSSAFAIILYNFYYFAVSTQLMSQYMFVRTILINLILDRHKCPLMTFHITSDTLELIFQARIIKFMKIELNFGL